MVFPWKNSCIEDHCIHWYHQSVWNEFASIESCMEVGSTNTTFTEKFGGIDINVEVPSEVNDELTGLALDHSQVVEGMKTEVKQLESLKVGKNMTESEARKLAKEKGVKILTSRWVNTQKTPTLARCRLVVRDFASGGESAFRSGIYAPTSSLDSLRCVLALASLWDLWLITSDVSTAFMYAEVEEDACDLVFTTIKHLIQRRKSCLSTFQSHERSPQSAVIVVFTNCKGRSTPLEGKILLKALCFEFLPKGVSFCC